MNTMWENQNVRMAVAFLVGLLVGIGGYWLATRNPSPINTSEGVLEETSTSTESIQGPVGIIIDQQPAGNSVVISQIAVADASWIAIRDSIDGKPGPRVLGAQLFTKDSTSGSVALLRSTLTGKEYFAVVYKDNGDGLYNSAQDTVVVDAEGNALMIAFTTSNVTAGAAIAPTNVVQPTLETDLIKG